MINRYLELLFNGIKETKKSIFTKGSFAQDFAFVFSGRAIGVLSQIIFTPLLARIYSPEAYGVFAVYSALLLNISTISTFRLEGALILPHSDVEFKRLLKSACLIVLFFSILVTIITVLSASLLNNWLGFEHNSNIIYALGPFVLLTGFYQLTSNWVVRGKQFKKSFGYETPVGVGTRIVNVLYGFFTKGAVHGLLFSDALLKLVSIFIRIRYVLNENFSFIKAGLTWKGFKSIIREYKQFPFYDMPATWLFMLSSQLPVYMIAAEFSNDSVGQVGFGITLLEVPLTLLANSIGPVFLQRIAQASRDDDVDVKRLVISLHQKLLYIGFLPFTIVAVFGDVLFALVFGPRWEPAGAFTSCLAIFYLFRLISSPLSSVYIIYGQQKRIFTFHLLLLIGRVACLAYGIFIMESVYSAIFLYGIVSAVGYMLLGSSVLKFVKADFAGALLKTLFIISCAAGILFLIRRVLF